MLLKLTLISWSFDKAESREFVPSLQDVRDHHASENVFTSRQQTI